MASISGIFYKKSPQVSLSSQLEKMLISIPKFNDDVSHSNILSNVALGQILSEKTQNFTDDRDLTPLLQDNILISQYARIDNKEELCLSLNLDHKISSQELILALYQKYGKDFAVHILGDFAIAIWDNTSQELVIAIDIFKTRPVFYYDCEEFFAFSSYVSALHALPEIKRAPNLTRIANQALFDNFYTDPEFNSYYQDIHYTPGNTVFCIKKDLFKTHNYWKPKITNNLKNKTEDELVKEFNSIFTQAIKARTKVSHPIGVMLSGGLDSSALTAMTCNIFKTENRTLEAFCNVLPLNHKGYSRDEREFIDLLKTDNLNINYMEHATEGPFDDLPGLLNVIEYPLYISQQYIHKAINNILQEKKVRILLDGVYGEIGPTFPDSTYLSRLLLTFRWVKLIQECRKRAKIKNKNWLNMLFRLTVSPLTPSIIKEKIRKGHRERTGNIGLLLNNDFIKKYSTLPKNHKNLRHNIRTPILDRKKSHLDFLNFIQHSQPLQCYSEKCGVEILHPYLDRRIIEFCLSLPDDMHTQNGYPRYFIRRTMQNIMPEIISKRLSKAAFVPDYMERYHADLAQVKKSFDHIKDHPKVKAIINLQDLSDMIERADKPGSFMGGQNIEAFMIVPTTIALGTFLAQF